MRTLQECQAEIFRRSEKRIAQRKKRRLAIGIPAIACLAIMSLLFLPSGNQPAQAPMEEISMENAQAETIKQSNASSVGTVPSAVQILLSTPDLYKCVTGPQDVAQVQDIISSAVPAEYLYSNAGMSKPENAPSISDGQTIDRHILSPDVTESLTVPCYTITLVYADGSNVSYSLMGICLTDTSTGNAYYLSSTDAEVIYSLLGVDAPLF